MPGQTGLQGQETWPDWRPGRFAVTLDMAPLGQQRNLGWRRVPGRPEAPVMRTTNVAFWVFQD